MDIPQRISRIREIAYNIWFSWQPETHQLFSLMDRQLWEEINHNSVKFLLYLYPKRLDEAAHNSVFLELYDHLVEKYDRYLHKKTWYQRQAPSPGLLVAYFSAELGIHESLPVYGGGLGVLAGDHCKSCENLGIPLVGVSILYKNGYFTQKIDHEGRQKAAYPETNFNEIPISVCRNQDGTPLILPVPIKESIIYVQVWCQIIGRTHIYLLDTDIPLNNPDDRKITKQLYGGNRDIRIAQEIVLGIGGVRALRKLGITPSVWHINEGHAAFLILERIREKIKEGASLQSALHEVKARTLFTTHTAVPAGHDLFPKDFVLSNLGQMVVQFAISCEAFLALGWDHEHQSFSMTQLAMKNAVRTNGVSKLHGEVSRKILNNDEITWITNGVHLPTWIAPEMSSLFAQYLGWDWMEDYTNQHRWKKIKLIPDQLLWQTHQTLKKKMISYVRYNLYQRLKRNLAPPSVILESLNKLNPETFTIGFARRFATYKRADLLLKDPDRLARLLNNPKQPVNIIFAGKAHPADHPGQEIIKRIWHLSQEKQFQGRIILAENYDIHLARYLLQGVDLWLNTPRRPMEACGTSGQKAALNGVINCSVPDGWWPEAFNGKNGFTIGGDQDFPNECIQDQEDERSLFHLLEQEIIPCYYNQKDHVPEQWICHMKENLISIPHYFNSERMVQDYYKKLYLPAFRGYN